MSLRSLLALNPLWGIPSSPEILEDWLTPYFWGFDVTGKRLPSLNSTLELVDGISYWTELDLILLGDRNVILIEAKHQGAPGRCGRYQMTRCPEIHSLDSDDLIECQYWSDGKPVFSDVLDLGPRPDPETDSPQCNLHYQLARTLLIGQTLAEHNGLDLGVWLILPRRRWSGIRRTWLEFADRVRDPKLWRRMRVITWESLESVNVN